MNKQFIITGFKDESQVVAVIGALNAFGLYYRRDPKANTPEETKRRAKRVLSGADGERTVTVEGDILRRNGDPSGYPASKVLDVNSPNFFSKLSQALSEPVKPTFSRGGGCGGGDLTVTTPEGKSVVIPKGVLADLKDYLNKN
jgi:hypothetical protein